MTRFGTLAAVLAFGSTSQSAPLTATPLHHAQAPYMEINLGDESNTPNMSRRPQTDGIEIAMQCQYNGWYNIVGNSIQCGYSCIKSDGYQFVTYFTFSGRICLQWNPGMGPWG